MSNLDLTISDIFYGDTAVLKIMKGDEQKWPYVQPMPYDAQVEYLQSSGTQYIDTGLYGTMDLDYEVEAYRVGNVRYNNVLGDRQSSSANRYTLMLDSNGQIYFNAGNSNQVTVQSINSSVSRIYKKEGLDMYIDGAKKGSVSSQTFTTPHTLLLFGARDNGNLSSMMTGRICHCKFIRNGVTVADFIPVRKDGVGYMYDKVSGELFGNAGSDSFTYGNDV